MPPILFKLHRPVDVDSVLFVRTLVPAYTSQVAGITKDANGNPLGGCTVHLFKTADDSKVAAAISDANGNYSFNTNPVDLYYVVAYLAGSPDVAGTTVNTLTGV